MNGRSKLSHGITICGKFSIMQILTTVSESEDLMQL